MLNDQYTLFINHILQVDCKTFCFFKISQNAGLAKAQTYTDTRIHTDVPKHTCIQRFVLVDPEAQKVATQPDGESAQWIFFPQLNS